MAGIITQVSQTPVQAHIQPPLLTRLSLDLRGKRFSVDRETIMNLPESVLLCLFPNGLVLSRQATSMTDQGENAEEEEVYGVDVRCRTLLFPLIQRLNLASVANPVHISSLLHSSTPIAFPSSYSSSVPLPILFTEQRHHRDFSSHNKISSMRLPPPTLLPTRTPCSQSKQSSSYERSWNTSPSHPRVDMLPQMRMELPTRACWISSAIVASIFSKRGAFSQRYNAMLTRKITLRSSI